MEEQGRDLIFALDIGTRSIIGIVGRRQNDLFHVEAFEQVQHPRRAMIDGQIEDIGQVARVAGEVKTRLEEKMQTRLRRVAVAAAGRALKTCTAACQMDLPAAPADAQLVYELENRAVNEARRLLDTGEDNIPYYCVGHSVVRYTIDGYPFTTLLGHGGGVAAAEVIATFLPAEVVTSLRRCMEMIDLEVDVLTLEPIAAMRAVLPPDIRLLNLAMVDVGAGTADIALTRDGTISGYTMATVAGDEITEAIIRKCLVDFETAERIKLSLETGDTIHYKDILGHEQSAASQDIINAIEMSVEMLAKVIADRIEECNGGPPMAVFLVGGGSRTPALCEKLAEKLALEPDKVALAGTNFSSRVLNEDAGLDSPEYATPVGIALTAALEEASGGATLTVNDRRVRLYTSEPSSVMDALLVAGYHYSDLMGRNGRSVTFTLNGERKVARGGQYSVAEITLNGKPAGLSSLVENGDAIEIQPAQSGRDAAPRVADYAGGAVPLAVTLNGSGVNAGLQAFVNGTPAPPATPIREGDEVELHVIGTVAELCAWNGIASGSCALFRNGRPAEPATRLENGDAVTTGEAAPAPEHPAHSPALGGEVIEDNPPPAPAVQSAPEETAAAAPQVVEEVSPPPLAELPTEAEAEPMPEAKPITESLPKPPATAESAPERTPEPEPESAPDVPAAPVSVPENKTEAAAESTLETETASGSLPVAKPEADPLPEALPETVANPAPPAPVAQNEPSAKAKPEPESMPSAETAPKPEPPQETQPEPPAAPAEESRLPRPNFTQTGPLPGGSLKIELNGRTVMLPPKAGGGSHFLLDMLPLVDIDPGNPKGRVLIRRNGADASYLDELVSGDLVEIRWEGEVPK